MVEFEVVDDRDLRQVMDELAALIEEGCVVFVAFDNEPFTVRETRALAEVVWNAADKIARVEAVVFEDPGEERSSGGLTVGAADHERAFAANKKFLEQLG